MNKNQRDIKIQEMIVKVEENTKKLGTKPRASWITNGLYRFDDNRTVNINTVNSESVLIDIMSNVLSAFELKTKAAVLLGLEYDNKVGAYTVDDWTADLKLKASILKWDREKKALDQLQAKLNNLISEDAKADMELAALEKLL